MGCAARGRLFGRRLRQRRDAEPHRLQRQPRRLDAAHAALQQHGAVSPRGGSAAVPDRPVFCRLDRWGTGERRVGEEGRTRWAPGHLKKKKKKKTMNRATTTTVQPSSARAYNTKHHSCYPDKPTSRIIAVQPV